MARLHSVAALCAAVALAACAPSTGVGTGVSRSGGIHASMAWTSSGATTGTMTADLSSGEGYRGPYFQLTHETRVDQLQPLWMGWGPRWGRMGGWDYWGPEYGSSFVTHYSGRVVANLQSADGRYMRCHFRLMRPSSGMAGGGDGRCQLPSGDSIDASFPPAG